jgi:hypothetical protein
MGKEREDLEHVWAQIEKGNKESQEKKIASIARRRRFFSDWIN